MTGRLRNRFGAETGTEILRSDLPIRSDGAPPFGVIEIAQNYKVVTTNANQTLFPVAGFLGLALVALYLSLMPILRRVTMAVEVRNRQLVEQATKLERSLAAAQEARTEAELARRAFAEQNKRLRELDRLKDEFLSLVSHELRTPLTSIRGYLELVLDEEAGELNTEQRRFLHAVERNSGRLLRLVGDLLFVAQADAGRLTLEPTSFDLSALAADSVEAARPAAREKAIKLLLSAEPVPLLVGDRGRLAQVLDNLISNALKFTPEGGAVEVRTSSDEEHATVAVFDTGIGIREVDQPRLFERFFRSSMAIDQAIPGTGLGLAIVEAIVKAHSGRISVDSEEGKGTTFSVELSLTARGEPAGRVEAAA
jgi:signal transduction histidine kinase